MGVDPKWGRFPSCPKMSRSVPVCPRSSRFVPVLGPEKGKRGQMGTKRDISGQIGKRPHAFRIHPHLALVEVPSLPQNAGGVGEASEGSEDRGEKP